MTVPRSSLLCSQRPINRFMNPRVTGIRKNRPRKSVKKPGVRRSTPPTRTMAPSSSSPAGSRPCASSDRMRRRRWNPWERTSQAPARLMASSRRTVGSGPISSPIFMMRYNSMIGTTVNRIKRRMSMTVLLSICIYGLPHIIYHTETYKTITIYHAINSAQTSQVAT